MSSSGGNTGAPGGGDSTSQGSSSGSKESSSGSKDTNSGSKDTSSKDGRSSRNSTSGKKGDDHVKHKTKDGHKDKGDSNKGGASNESRTTSARRQEICVGDEAVEVEDTGGRVSRKSNKTDSAQAQPARLLLVSSKIKSIVAMQTALLSTVTLVQYKYESATLDGILGK